MYTFFAQIEMFAVLQESLPLVLAAIAGAFAAFGLNRFISSGSKRRE